MALVKDRKKEVIKKFAEHEKDTGSSNVQIALLTERINGLADHFKAHRRDFNSRVGLLRLVGKRKRLLDYLKKENPEKYRELADKLSLKK